MRTTYIHISLKRYYARPINDCCVECICDTLYNNKMIIIAASVCLTNIMTTQMEKHHQ